MRKLLAGLVAVLSLSLVTAQISVAAVTPGSKCTKVGATSTYNGKKYTCVKSGKKLVWNKGVALPKPAHVASPTSTPSNSPSNNPIPKIKPIPIWLNPFTNISIESRKAPTLPELQNIEISSNVDLNLATNLLKYQNLASSYWKSLGFESSYPIHILVLSEKDYAIYASREFERKLSCIVYCNEKNWFSPDFSGRFQGTVLVEGFDENISGRSLPMGLTFLYIIGTSVLSKDPNWSDNLGTAFTHEYGHLIQFSYLEGWRNFSKMACWNNEGFPAFFEDAFYYEDSNEINQISVLRPKMSSLNWLNERRITRLSNFKNARLNVIQSMSGLKGGNDAENWRKYFELTRQRNSEGCTKDGYGRASGYFISQVFYEDFGAKGFLEILRLTNLHKDWERGFRELSGRDYIEWIEVRVIPSMIDLFG